MKRAVTSEFTLKAGRDMQNMMVGIYRIVHELYIAIFILSK